jgi:hypothetical protein
MLFQFFRHQLQAERPTISSTMRRANENGLTDIGPYMCLQGNGDLSCRSANPVLIMLKGARGRAAKQA